MLARLHSASDFSPLKTMKVVLILLAFLIQLIGKTDATFDMNAFFDGISGDDCPVAQTEGCPSQLTYWIFTRDNPGGKKLEQNEIPKAGLLQGKPLKVLVHGYQNNSTSLMITSLKDAYLDKDKKEDIYNILAVDWGYFVKAGCYAQGVASINPVAGCATNVIKMMKQQVRFSNVHILGHSLGAHVAAIISSHDGLDIDRLTRFDPAQPLFSIHTTNEGKATFRDTYHSNIGILAQSPEQGDIDVYLNADNFQPGCGCDLPCSHMRSVLYFAESIRSGMKGFYCSSWEKYENDECVAPTKETLLKIGEDADTTLRGSIKVFGKEDPAFLFSDEDYLERFNEFKKLCKGKCYEEIDERLKAYILGKD